MNENSSYAFHFEHAPAWKRLPAGRLTLRGWFINKTEHLVHDLRVLIHGRAYPARHGLLRPDLAAQWPAFPAANYAGFEVELETGPGDTSLQLQLLNHDFRWVEIWHRPLAVSVFTLAGPARARLNHTYLPALIRHELQRSITPVSPPDGWPREEWFRQACAPAHEFVAALPWHAALDVPKPVSTARYDLIHVCGWAFHETQRIKSLYATTALADFHPLKFGMPQGEVARNFAHFPTAQACMFFGIMPLAAKRANPAPLKIYAELEDGTHHLILARRFWATPLPDAELPLPADNLRPYLDTVEALHHELVAGHIDTGGLRKFSISAKKSREWLRDWFSTKNAPFAWEALSLHERQQQRQALTPRLAQRLYAHAEALTGATPGLALLTTVDARTCHELAALVASLRAQIFRKWELRILATDAAVARLVSSQAETDSRISVVVATALADVTLDPATDYVTLVDPGAVLRPDALLQVAEAAHGVDAPLALFTDEETIDAHGTVTAWPWAEWSPALAFSGAITGLVFLSKNALQATGGFPLSADPIASALAAWWQLTAQASAGAVKHLASYAVRRPVRAITPVRTAALLDAVNRTLQARGFEATAFVPEWTVPAGHCWVQIRWSENYLARNPVSIVIPTRDRLDLLQRCIQNLELTVNWQHARLIVVDDGSREPKAARFLRELAARTDLPVRVIPGGDPTQPFNYSRLVNLGTAAADTPLVLHLNNDVDALASGWLEDMAGWFAFADTGAVGAKLLYADGRINHAGIVIDSEEALPFTPFEGLPETLPEHHTWHRLARDTSAVIGGCLLTRTDLYRQLEGFETERFGVAYNDVDFCLRLRAAGWRVVYSPQARLVHWGSESRGRSFHESEHLAFLARYGKFQDPCFSPHLRLAGRSVAPQLEATPHASRIGALRLLVATHNLGLEGAPLFLFEFVEHAIKVDGCTVQLLAYSDGPLRSAYEALGVRITIVDRHPVHASLNPVEYADRVGQVRRSLDLSRLDLVVANTVLGYWVIELAKQAGLPSLWFIHESVRVPRFFEHEVPPGMQTVVHAAFREATRVVFLCEATRRYYDEFNGRDHFRIVSGWVDVERIRAFRAQLDRRALRAQHGIGENELVIANVGTLCERKGQHYFLPAAKRLLELHRGPVRFLMVGGLNDLYHELFAAEPALAACPQATIVTKTDSVYDYYALADLAVCSSYEESFPRVLMEAMVFGIMLVSTDVHGVPEIITDRAEGLLVKPGNVEELARTMVGAAAQSRTPNSLAPLAVSKVMRRFDKRHLIPRHLAIAREAAVAG